MSVDPATVETVTFDSYSTIVDVDAAEQALADRVPDPEPVSRPRNATRFCRSTTNWTCSTTCVRDSPR
jgi:FMN phosphatase YigB (HAD superfamily)